MCFWLYTLIHGDPPTHPQLSCIVTQVSNNNVMNTIKFGSWHFKSQEMDLYNV